MSDEQTRIEALEQFAIRITRLTPQTWADEETANAAVEAIQNPTNEAALRRVISLISKGVDHRKTFEAQAQTADAPSAAPSAAPSQQTTVNQNEILRRNTLLLDWYEREVSISKSYTTVISGLGYAGLLAIWGGLRDHIDKVTLLGSASLIAASLIVFVFWER